MLYVIINIGQKICRINFHQQDQEAKLAKIFSWREFPAIRYFPMSFYLVKDVYTSSQQSPVAKKVKLETAAAVYKLPVAPISKKKQEPRLPQPFQLPGNFNPTIAEALKSEMLSGKCRGKFLQVIADSIFRYKSYPTDDEYKHVAQQMVKKWPFLSNGGNHVSSQLPLVI